MKVHEYICVHRCYGALRQHMPSSRRITFEELAILAHLSAAQAPLHMSDLAEYQGALRPTITHRVSHLEKLGFVLRSDCSADHRTICCAISKEGELALNRVLKAMYDQVKLWSPSTYASKGVIAEALNNAGSLSLSAADLILVALESEFKQQGIEPTVGNLSAQLGVLQPTISMAVAKLENKGLVTRVGSSASSNASSNANASVSASSSSNSSSSTTSTSNSASSNAASTLGIVLTSAGKKMASKISSRIEAISVL